jgi:hypothetical protein
MLRYILYYHLYDITINFKGGIHKCFNVFFFFFCGIYFVSSEIANVILCEGYIFFFLIRLLICMVPIHFQGHNWLSNARILSFIPLIMMLKLLLGLWLIIVKFWSNGDFKSHLIIGGTQEGFVELLQLLAKENEIPCVLWVTINQRVI